MSPNLSSKILSLPEQTVKQVHMLAQVKNQQGQQLMESCAFVDKGSRYTLIFSPLVSGLCFYMSASAVAKYLKLRWETLKNMDKLYLKLSLSALNPEQLTCLKYWSG